MPRGATAKRISKFVAYDLIKYARSLKVEAPYYGEASTSALEFFRQMSSPNLKAKNDSFEVTLKSIELPTDSIPKVKAEFLDGSSMDVDSSQYDTMQLREMFYEAAREAESALSSAGAKKK